VEPPPGTTVLTVFVLFIGADWSGTPVVSAASLVVPFLLLVHSLLPMLNVVVVVSLAPSDACVNRKTSVHAHSSVVVEVIGCGGWWSLWRW
jgi:hypothetical protein